MQENLFQVLNISWQQFRSVISRNAVVYFSTLVPYLFMHARGARGKHFPRLQSQFVPRKTRWQLFARCTRLVRGGRPSSRRLLGTWKRQISPIVCGFNSMSDVISAGRRRHKYSLRVNCNSVRPLSRISNAKLDHARELRVIRGNENLATDYSSRW